MLESSVDLNMTRQRKASKNEGGCEGFFLSGLEVVLLHKNSKFDKTQDNNKQHM